jgi:multidrug resistance efflux pump
MNERVPSARDRVQKGIAAGLRRGREASEELEKARAEIEHLRAELAQAQNAAQVAEAVSLMAADDRDEALGEAESLRAELADRDDQVAAVRALHDGRTLRGGTTVWCDGCEFPWPCPTIRAAGGAS